METDLLSAEISAPSGATMNEDNFVYAAAKVFNIIAPYIDHTDASRVFSEVSAALRRAQEASAEATVFLQASEKAQRRERELRALDANRHLSRLRELQGLLEARMEREAASKAKRQSLRRRLAAETERASDLERRLAESEVERLRLEKAVEEVRDEKRALSESWKSSLDREVAAAKVAVFQESKTKIEEATVRRMRSLSSEVSQLRRKIRDLQVENAGLKKNLHPRPPSTSLNTVYRANGLQASDRTFDTFANLLGVSRPGEAGSKHNGEIEAPTGTTDRHRRNASAGFAEAVPIVDNSRHHSRIDRHRDALVGIKEDSTPSSQPLVCASRRKGKDGDWAKRETPLPPLPYRWWSFFDRTSGNKSGHDERVMSSPRRRAYVPSARVSDEVLHRQAVGDCHGGGLAEAVLSAPMAGDGASEARVDPAPRDTPVVRRYSGVGDVNINGFGAAGGGRRRGLGALPRSSSFRRGSARMIEVADDGDSSVSLGAVRGPSVGEAFVGGTTLRETKRSDSDGGNNWQRVSLGGDSTPLSLRDLITSGEFYPGGVSRAEHGMMVVPSDRPSGATGGSGATLGAAADDRRSGGIGLRGHSRKTSLSAEYAGILEETKAEARHRLPNIPRGKNSGDKKFTVAPAVVTQSDIRPGRGGDIPPDATCYHYTPSTLRKVFGEYTNSSGQQLSSSFAGVLEGNEGSEQNIPRSPRRSVSAPVGVLGLGDGARTTSDCRETDRQESLDDFLRKLTVVTGGDVAAGGDRSRRRLELGVGEDCGVDFGTGEGRRVEAEDRADAVIRA